MASLPPRPHPLTRAPLVDRIDGWLERSWERGWLPPPPHDCTELFARGSKGFAPEAERAGRSAEDVADFRERLARLCSAVSQEAGLNALGRTFAYGQLVRAVKQRFALGALWAEDPALLETPIAPPIVVVGQMRSGTTRVHRLLAADPAHSATRFCDSWHPVPERPDFRPVRGGFKLFVARKLDPWIDTIHPFGAARVDEELGWLATALCHSAYEAQWRVPSYTAWSEARDPAPVYREFVRMLRTDAGRHGNASRPRVLKTPQFAEDLETLLAQFPGARVVVCRRDDEETLRSTVSLVANQMTIQADRIDLAELELEWQRKMTLRDTRTNAALARFAGPVATLDFARLDTDWRGAIAAVYEALGLDLTDAARAAMDREMASAEGSPHRRHAANIAGFAAPSETPTPQPQAASTSRTASGKRILARAGESSP